MDDPEDEGKKGKRKDGKDLTKAWLDRYGNRGAYRLEQGAVRRDRPGEGRPCARPLRDVAHGVRVTTGAKDKAGEPSLAEMADKAIDILARNPEGFVLMIEGGRVDHGSHAGNAFRTLTDAVALNEAVKAVLRKVNLDETLIVVTGDHSHTLTIAGYAKRGNPILGISIGVDGKPILATDGKPYTTISFANGPGGIEGAERAARRSPWRRRRTPTSSSSRWSRLPSETHGGEDLGIYAIGPWSHLFQGTVEENYTFHVMDFASKISERAKAAAIEPAAAP